MASISKRGDDRADEIEPAPWDERPIIGVTQGLPWWQAIVLAFGLALFAAVVDLQFNDKLTVLFQGAYFVACLAAVGWVQRGSLFAPMVQPPLILAIIVPGVVLFTSDEIEGSGLKDLLLGYGLPVINGFPTMAITTGATVAAGVLRMFLQRDPGEDADDDAEDLPPRGRPRDEAAAAPATRGRRAIPDEDDPDDEPAKRPLLDKVRKFMPARGSEPDDEPPARDSDPDAERTRRSREPVEPPPARRGAPGEPPPRRGAPPPGLGGRPVPGAGPDPKEPRPGAVPPGRNPSGPTQRPPRTPPERRPEAPGAGPGPGGPGGPGAAPPPGRRRAPSEPVRRPVRGEGAPPPSRGEGAEPPPRRAAPKPPPGGPPPGGPPPAGGPPPGGPPGGQPPRRRPAPPDDQPRPPRRQPPPPRRRPWDDQG